MYMRCYIHLIVSKTAPIFVQLKGNHSAVVKCLELLFGWSICSAALLWGSNTVVERLCATVLYASCLHIVILASVPTAAKERNFRLRVIYAGVMPVGFLIIFAALVIANVPSDGPESDSESPDSTPKSKKSQLYRTSLELFLSLTYSWVCFEYIALCYRMDYAFALESGGVNPTPKFRRPEGASPDKKFHAVRVLTSLRPVFDKPYYTASIAGVVLSAISLASLTVGLDTDGQIMHGPLYAVSGYYLNLIGSPIICMPIMALAYWRGEVRKVWGYGERWLDVPEGAPFISADDESSESAPELEFCENLKEKDAEDEKYEGIA